MSRFAEPPSAGVLRLAGASVVGITAGAGLALAFPLALVFVTGAGFGAGCLGLLMTTFPMVAGVPRTAVEPFLWTSTQLQAPVDRIPLLCTALLGLVACAVCAATGGVPLAGIVGTAVALAVGLWLAVAAGPDVEVKIELHRLLVRRGQRSHWFTWDEVVCALAEPLAGGGAELVLAAPSGMWHTGLRGPTEVVLALVGAIDARVADPKPNPAVAALASLWLRAGGR